MGFEIERFLCDVDEEFICPICSGVLEDPLQTPDCEHAFCRACITEWISRQPTCPVDRQPITASQLRPAPRLIRNLLSRLSTSCNYAPQGCNAVLKLESLTSHSVECEFNPRRLVPCEAGCGLVIPKDERAKHNCFRELWGLIATHRAKSDDYKEELTELKRAHQEKLNDYEQKLAELRRAHQEKLKDHEQELAGHKRAHQEKLNEYEQELANLKRELAELKESRQEMRQLQRSATRGSLSRIPYLRPVNFLSPPAGLMSPFTGALERAREREEVVRWSNTLALASFDNMFDIVATPPNDVKMSIRGSLSESGCPRHIIDDLVINSDIGRWPSLLRSSYGGGTIARWDEIFANANYVCKRVPGQRAVVILHCDNTRVDQQMMVKPGFIMIFLRGGV